MKKVKLITFGVTIILLTGVLFSIIYLWSYQSSTADINKLPTTCLKAIKRVENTAPESFDNCKVRQWYLQQINTIPITDQMLVSEKTELQTRAQCAFNIRHRTRVSARTYMASTMDVILLRFRDWIKYGQPDGPSFDQLVAKSNAGDRDKSSIWKGIIVSAQRTNQQVNESCGL